MATNLDPEQADSWWDGAWQTWRPERRAEPRPTAAETEAAWAQFGKRFDALAAAHRHLRGES